MELELGLALPNARPPAGEFVGLINSAAGACGKRGFGEAFGAGKATLPLFVRDGEGSDGEGGGDGVVDCEMGSKRKKLVGWPPVKCAHKRSCGGGGGYVKVKMEGVAIGRKVGVSLHGSYDELLRTLDRMFPSANQDAEEDVTRHDRRRRHPYVVTYEDGEGDWLLVGDVPWEAFAKSVKRLKILA
ncbi:auxin-responsive protein IAA20-like isoform X2 [Phragmites australis]|uniref:auxin-responsive protein IAA20-like isoform X2 n=1 Tax=Phragmites australis TaxID=29695 RepID=UPI002D764C57|nr:auxin-responsive protein IAA20-like isoform X2 [Phragmites australis]